MHVNMQIGGLMNHHKIVGITFSLLVSLSITGCASAAARIVGNSKIQDSEKNVEIVKEEAKSTPVDFGKTAR